MRKLRSSPIRAVIIDDSLAVKELLISILQNSGDILVVGTGTSGEDAVRLVERLHPDIVTMDLRIPDSDGLKAIRKIMRECPTPIVIITSFIKQSVMDLTFQALQAGALTVISKPGLNDPETCDKVVQTVRLMADVPVIHHWDRKDKQKRLAEKDSEKEISSLVNSRVDISCSDIEIIGIAASTGGPSALVTVLRNLPNDFPLPILIVQHISQGFVGGLAEWLSTETSMRVEIANHGDILLPGVVMVSPDDYHLQVGESGIVELSKAPLYKGFRPSANYLFESLARVFGSHAMGVILTGMGDDGVEGINTLSQAGGVTVAQDEESCVVYGMPHQAVARNAVHHVLTLEQIALTFEKLGCPSSTGRPQDRKGRYR